jgi:hypothetical protein
MQDPFTYKSDSLFLSRLPSNRVFPSHLHLQSQPRIPILPYILLEPFRSFTKALLHYEPAHLETVCFVLPHSSYSRCRRTGAQRSGSAGESRHAHWRQGTPTLSPSAHDADLSAHREPCTHLASVVVAKQIIQANRSLRCLRIS